MTEHAGARLWDGSPATAHNDATFTGGSPLPLLHTSLPTDDLSPADMDDFASRLEARAEGSRVGCILIALAERVKGTAAALRAEGRRAA